MALDGPTRTHNGVVLSTGRARVVTLSSMPHGANDSAIVRASTSGVQSDWQHVGGSQWEGLCVCVLRLAFAG